MMSSEFCFMKGSGDCELGLEGYVFVLVCLCMCVFVYLQGVHMNFVLMCISVVKSGDI